MIPTNSKTWNPRNRKAQAILKMTGAIKSDHEGIFKVRSQTGNGSYKVVNNHGWKCDCPDHMLRGRYCKHILATRYYLQIEQETEQGTVFEKIPITYKQAWSAYNQAQAQEIKLFDELLKELVITIPEPEQHMGRPRLKQSDKIFCAIQKVYSQLSGRRANSLFERALEHEQLSHAPHYNAVSKTLLKKEITQILRHLVQLSASPLAGIETDFAVDSSGFRTNSFGHYCAEKHGTKRKNLWVKAHICTGVTTNIVSDAIVTRGEAGDSPQFDRLVRNTAGHFVINEVSADKAYSSRDNHDTVKDVGGTAYIPFKSNSTGKAKGSLVWKKAFHFFQFHRDVFSKHFHKRSNAETTFGAIKAKFGEVLKSKKFTAQVNEVLCKIIAYNITVLIHEMFESGIVPEFLDNQQDT